MKKEGIPKSVCDFGIPSFDCRVYDKNVRRTFFVSADGGIRTRVPVARLTDFESAPL